MLQVLLGKEKSHLNLILDSTCNVFVKFGLINQLTTWNEDSALFCFQLPTQVYQSRLKKIPTLYDGFTDPFSWFKESNTTNINLQGLLSNTKPICLIIDDLLLFGRAAGCIDGYGDLKQLHHLLRELSAVHYVFAFINPQLTKDGILRSLLHICTSQMKIFPTTSYKQPYEAYSILRKKSGKVLTEKYTLSFKGDELVLMKARSNSPHVSKLDDSNEPDPASNLTFNLRLTESEKEARAKSILPYLLTDTNKAAFLKNTNLAAGGSGVGGSGNVIYTPDDADDFDDEDPDDDLDI